MPSHHHHGEEKHEHRGKFSEGVLDNELILKTLDLGPGQKALDAGCGNGYMAKLFAQAVGPSGRVYAMDGDPQFINPLIEETKDGNLLAMLGDISQNIPLPDSSLDVVYISTVMHGFSPRERQGFPAEAVRLLKPGGRLGIVEFKKEETNFGPPLSIRLSPEDLKALIPMTPVETMPVAEHFYLQVFRKD